MAAPRTIIVPAVKKHTATVICLHGLGDSGAGWSFLAENWRRRNKYEDVTFIFPSAPPIPISVNGGMKMPGWYDIISFDTINRSEDEEGIMRSRTYIHSLINEQIKGGIPADRIVVGGFSQGGAMSLFAGLTFTERLAGVFGLSCYQLLDVKFKALCEETGHKRPIVFMGHGDSDPLVRTEWGRITSEGLKKKGFDVSFKTYPGVMHSVCEEEIDDLDKWLAQRLNESDSSKV